MAHPQHQVLLGEADSQSANSQPGGKRPRYNVYEKYVQNWWLTEILALMIGVGCIIALCALLPKYDQQPASQSNEFFGVNITLNTLVSILSSLGRAALLFSVAECVSQLKWMWYLKHDRPLADLDIFDGASRGPWGGLKLLWRVNIRQFASVGALLIIGSLAVDPLSQQLVQFKVVSVQDETGSANLPTAISLNSAIWEYTNTPDVGGSSIPDPPLAMKAAILNGMYTDNSAVLDLQPTCSSGNCTWPSYRSLAICARSANVTSHLRHKTTKKGPRWYLSELNYITDDTISLFSLSSAALQPKHDEDQTLIPLNFSNSIAFRNSSAPVADIFVIYTNSLDASDDSPATFLAFEFVLEWCVQTFNTSVTNGTSLTERHDSFSDFGNRSTIDAFLTATPSDGDNLEYSVDPDSHYTLQNYFWGLFQGTANLTSNNATLSLYPSTSNDATQAFFQPFDIFGKKVNGVDQVPGRGVGLVGLQTMLDNVATGMTNMIRNSTAGDSADSNPMIQGTANKQVVFVQIQWGWLAAPIILSAVSTLFVLAAIIQSLRFGSHQKPEVWKSSSLPLLKALNKELHQDGSSGMTALSAMDTWAKDVPVRLSRDEDEGGWKLVPRFNEKDNISSRHQVVQDRLPDHDPEANQEATELDR